MKWKVIFLSVFYCLVAFGFLSAQSGIVDNLCYDEEFRESISIVADLDISSLSILDKVKFQKKRYVKKHHEYFNSAGNATHDVHFVSQRNVFPKWYNPPTTTRIDETGVKAYFTTNNSKYLPNGWAGSIKSQTEHGEYIEDLEKGERYYFQEYSEVEFAQQGYQAWNEMAKSVGFLGKYTFSYPSDQELQGYSDLGFEVTSSNNIIRIQNAEFNVVWDVAGKIIVKQRFESGTLAETEKTYYQYVPEFDSDLIHEIVTIVPGHFDNGDCYETVTRRIFSNYSTGCSQRNVSFREANSESLDKESEGELEVFPNPVEDRLNIKIPASGDAAIIQISNVNGEIMIQRKVKKGKSSISVRDLPAGVYIVKCQQGENNFSTKFIKQ